MKSPACLVVIFLFTIGTALGQSNYNTDFIADTLLKNADAVVRFSHTSYKRISAGKFIQEVHYAITILNPNGKRAGDLFINYDRNSKVSQIKGFLYDKKGILLRKVNKKEIRDEVLNNEYTLYSDNRVMTFVPLVSRYPFTVEYKYSIEETSIVGFETWVPQQGLNVALEEAVLSFTTPLIYDIRYKSLNYPFNYNCNQSQIEKIHTWSAKGIKPIKHESNMPNYLDFMPSVLLSPNEIAFEGTIGDFSTWESYGKWTYNLILNRDELPAKTEKYIKALTDTIYEKKEKIKAIYKFMQSRTRYVNIALGLGGFQPILAQVVDEKGYGDCKALSNYTKALLKCAGIESYYTEIGSGENQEIKFTDFASANQTNHIILCVPADNDTVWLECTNQKAPCGFISSGSSNRYALLIKPNGGELVRTPSHGVFHNTRTSNISLTINESGNADFEILTQYNNDLYEEVFGLINLSSKEQKDVLLKNLIASKGIEIARFVVEDMSNDNPKAMLYVNGKINNFASKAGTMMLVSPEFFYPSQFPDFIHEQRSLDMLEPISYSYIDTLRIKIPDIYLIKKQLDQQSYSSAIGHCSYQIDQSNCLISIVRKIVFNKGKYGKEQFNEINEFLRNIALYEKNNIILTLK